MRTDSTAPKSTGKPDRPRPKLRTPPLHEGVESKIREMIVQGLVQPGEHLIEAKLCSRFRISRTPLREALKVLASEELVEIIPHRGARVALMSAEQSRHLFEAIAAIESAAAELAAVRMTDAELNELIELTTDMKRCARNDDINSYFDLNARIHMHIIACARNPVLQGSYQTLASRVSRGRYRALTSPGRLDTAISEHDAIIEAFRNGDSAAAAAAWKSHLQRTAEAVCRSLAAGSSTDARAAISRGQAGQTQG